MKTKSLGKSILIIVSIILAVIVFLAAYMLIKQGLTDRKMNDDYSAVLTNEAYQEAVSVDDIYFIEQEVSCGYAIIEMLSDWQGKDITEQTLLEENDGVITTAMGTGFLDEITKQFPEWNITRYTNLTNSELLSKVYDSLAAGKPVPFEFAALYDNGEEEVWTLHFAVIKGMDLRNDAITVLNPYGYEETYSVDSFLKATRYESYENMPLFLKFAFSLEIFNKKTVYIIN